MGIATRVLLSLVCQLARTLAHHRQCHHVATFGVLRGPEHAKASQRKPRCLLDPWALRLVRFDADKVVLSGETIAAILETAASLIKLDIAGIEALHDSMSRRLLTRGTHRPAEYLEEVHAEFVFDSIRRRGKPWSPTPIGKHGAPVAEQEGRGCAKYLFQMRNPLQCMHSAGAWSPTSNRIQGTVLGAF